MTQYFERGTARELGYVLPRHSPKFKIVSNYYWSNPESWARDILARKKENCWDKSGWDTGNPSWYGTQDIHEAIRLAQDGWKEGVEKVNKLLNRIKAEHPFQLKPIEYGIAGTHPDVPRAVSGNPLNMHLPDLTKTKKRKIITLVSNMGGHCGFNAEEFCNRAAVIVGIVDAIESNGYTCDVVSYGMANEWYHDQTKGTSVMSSCIVKNSNQPADIARLAFGLGHPGMFRRFTFCDLGSEDQNKDIGSCLGYPGTVEGCCDVSQLKDRNIFTIPGLKSSMFDNEDKAMTVGLNYIVEDLVKQGFPLHVK